MEQTTRERLSIAKPIAKRLQEARHHARIARERAQLLQGLAQGAVLESQAIRECAEIVCEESREQRATHRNQSAR